ncbi:MaoC family dehydratase N-terminal domain-containing protein [Streptomyces sp. BH-SS-21]|uniref:MaoC family dehydratase N-terminal domain-containing protein n=1 Tax=Streptomyces liliiviolaceus TaxID=2823109 RepID=A0A940XZA6_9ACTN|nr:MaoC family dehydratase N-terminal domain-containing protein [Streptomyces liliiviolaceus]MBQ0854524.1 MaoC family dehydratase N-terminal domain-containing protein [Streptomyces liliiviolaceus]
MNALIDTVVDRVVFDVERGKILEFVRATFTDDPVHTDPGLAAENGFSGAPATATHVVVAGHHRDQRTFVERLGLELSRVVVGSVDWTYRRPLVAGDTLRGTRRVVGDETREGRRGGTMRLITLETEFVDGRGELAVTQREVLIERGRP